MRAQIGRFSRVAFDPGARRSLAPGPSARVCFSASVPKSGPRPGLTPHNPGTVVPLQARESWMAQKEADGG